MSNQLLEEYVLSSTLIQVNAGFPVLKNWVTFTLLPFFISKNDNWLFSHLIVFNELFWLRSSAVIWLPGHHKTCNAVLFTRSSEEIWFELQEILTRLKLLLKSKLLIWLLLQLILVRKKFWDKSKTVIELFQQSKVVNRGFWLRSKELKLLAPQVKSDKVGLLETSKLFNWHELNLASAKAIFWLRSTDVKLLLFWASKFIREVKPSIPVKSEIDRDDTTKLVTVLILDVETESLRAIPSPIPLASR